MVVDVNVVVLVTVPLSRFRLRNEINPEVVFSVWKRHLRFPVLVHEWEYPTMDGSANMRSLFENSKSALRNTAQESISCNKEKWRAGSLCSVGPAFALPCNANACRLE